jgi:protein involved in polysaccharide export with SLBB domain
MTLTPFQGLPRRAGQPAALAACLLALCVSLAGCHQLQVIPAGSIPPGDLVKPSPNLRDIKLPEPPESARNDMIYHGDLIEVTIFTGEEDRPPAAWPLRVMDNGVVVIPEVGPVQVAGLLLTDAEQVVRSEAIDRKKYVNPRVLVTVRDPKKIYVHVSGAAKNPGRYPLLAKNDHLTHALRAAGELDVEKATPIVEIRNPMAPAVVQAGYNGQPAVPKSVERIDLSKPLPGDDPRYRLVDGASIVVEEQKPRYVSVGGWVQKAGRFQIKPGEEWRLMNAITEAGDVKRQGLVDTVYVQRQLNTMQAPVVIKCSYKAARLGGPDNLLLADGDVVTVQENRVLVILDEIKGWIVIPLSSLRFF